MTAKRTPKPKTVKIRYAGGCVHEASFPGGADIDHTVRVVFDEEGLGEMLETDWPAVEPHAANAGIVRV